MSASSFVQSGDTCPVCLGCDHTVISPVFDDRYGQPHEYWLSRCNACHHLMTLPRLGEADLPGLYGTYYPRKNIFAKSVAQQAVGVTSRWCALRRWFAGTDNQGQYVVRAGERMLDIGCGSGLSLLEAQAIGAHVWGIEADPNVQSIAAALGLRVHQGSLNDRPFPEVMFDLVILNQVIEHLPQPDQALALIRERLVSGGRVVLVFPNIRSFWCRLSGARWINWHVPYHLHHFDLSTFTQLASRCGYRVRWVRTITPNLWTLLQFRASRVAVTRGTPSPLWAVPAQPAVSQNSAPASPVRPSARRVLRRAILNSLMLPLAVINRVIDGLGWGDSLMVEIVPVEHP